MTAAQVEDDPLAPDPLQRDQWGRPLIIPAGRGGKPNLKAKPVGYTRASSLADAIGNQTGLTKWRLWCLAVGLGRNPDLAALAGVYGPTYDNLSRSDKRELDGIIERAHDRVGGNAKADHGTTVHALTEPDPLGVVPDRMAEDVAAYHAALTAYGLEVVDTEVFTVNDAVQTAGTYDHKVRLTRDLAFLLDKVGTCEEHVTLRAGTQMILDKKTGKLHFDSQSIQLAVYANASRYDPLTGERTPLDVSTDWAILAHIPMGEKVARLYLIDIHAGWVAAKIAAGAMEHQKRKNLGVAFPALDTPQNAVEPAPIAQPVAEPDDGEYQPGGPADPGEPVEPPAVNTGPSPAVAAQLAEAERFAAELDAAKARAKAATKPAASGWPEDEPTIEQAAELITEKLDATTVYPLHTRISMADSRDDLSRIWREAKAAGETWTDEHTDIFRDRAAQLDAS